MKKYLLLIEDEKGLLSLAEKPIWFLCPKELKFFEEKRVSLEIRETSLGRKR